MPGNLYDEAIEALQQPPQPPPAAAAGPPRVPLPDLYEEARQTVETLQQQQGTRVRRSLLESADVSPDRAAEARRLSLQLGIPPAVLLRNWDLYTKRQAVEGQPYGAMQTQTPAMAAWLEDPMNAALAKDDLAQLGALEWLLTAPQRAWRRGVAQVEFGQLQHQSLFRPLTQAERERADRLHADMQTGGALGASDSWFRQAVIGTAGQVPILFGAGLAGLKYGIPAAVTAGTGASLAGPAAPVTVPTAFTAGMTAGTMVGGAEFSFQLESGLAFDEYRRFTDDLGQPLDPDVAKAAALASGVLNGGLEVVGLGALVRSIPGGKRLVGMLSRDVIKQTLRSATVRAALKEAAVLYGQTLTAETAVELGQRAVTILSGEVAKVASGQTIAPKTPTEVASDLYEETVGALQSFLLIAAPGPTIHATLGVREARRAQRNVAFFEALGEGVANSKTAQRAPEALQDLLEQATQDGPIPDVYVPTAPWVAYWQTQGLDPAQVAAEVTGDATALPQALETGGDLRIPTARYAARLAGTPHNAALAPDLRLGPTELTAREAEQVLAAEAEAQAALETAAAEPAGTGTPTPAEQVQAAIAARLEATGMSRAEAEANATLVAAGFGQLTEAAALEGIDPLTLLRQYGIAIERTTEAQAERPPAVPVTGAGTVPPPAATLPLEPAAAVPFLITRQMEADLRAAGVSQAEINAMTPAEAHARLAAPAQTVVYDAAGQRRLLSPEQAATYQAQAGETVVAETRTGLRVLEDRGGKLPPGREPRIRVIAGGVETLNDDELQELLDSPNPQNQAAAAAEVQRRYGAAAAPGLTPAAGVAETAASALESGAAVAEPGAVSPAVPEAVAGAAAGPVLSDRAQQLVAAHAGGDVEGAGVSPGAAVRRLPTPADYPFVAFEPADPDVDAARLTPGVRRELTRLADELREFPFVARVWHWLGLGEGKTGTAAGGAADIIGGAAGAPVYDDILQFSPLNKGTKGQALAKMVRGTRAQVEAAVRRTLETGRISSNLAEGAVRVAEHRDAGDYADLSPPLLPPSWGEVADEQFTDDLRAAIDAEVDAGALEVTEEELSAAAQEAEAGEAADISFDVSEFGQSLIDLMQAEGEPARAGLLPHGAVAQQVGKGQTLLRLPGGASITLWAPHVDQTIEGYAFVHQATVPADQRGRGIGRQLYAAALGYARSQGYKGLSSDPSWRNDASDAIWRALARDGVVERRGEYDVLTSTGAPTSVPGVEGAAVPAEDVLPTGEVQPRLPGAEAVREQDIPTPTLEAPFALTPEVAEDEPGFQGTLFQKAAEPDTKKFALTHMPMRVEQGLTRLSTRVPEGQHATERQDVLETRLSTLDEPEARDAKARYAKVARESDLLTREEKRRLRKDDDATLELFVRRAVSNLRWLWNQFPEDLRERAKQWYVGGHRIAAEIARSSRVTHRQAVAVLAVFSPRTDWFVNVANARWFAAAYTEAEQTNPVFTPARIAAFIEKGFKAWRRENPTEAKDPAIVAAVRAEFEAQASAMAGRAWRDLTISQQARLLRVLVEDAHPDASHPVILPEGGDGPLKRNKDGTLARARSGSYEQIARAIRVLRHGTDPNVLNQIVGEEHKVRSFFNNLSDPTWGGAVTVDTHATGAVYLKPFGLKSKEVADTLGGRPKAKGAGLSGFNPVVAEAYFRLAEQLTRETGRLVLPREVQSVTWEAIRLLFPAEEKTAALQKHVNALWRQHAAGKLSANEVRSRIATAVGRSRAQGGLGRPDWADIPAGVAAHQGVLSARDVRALDARVPAGPVGAQRDPTRATGRGAALPEGVIRAVPAPGQRPAAVGPRARTLSQVGRRGAITIGPNRQITIRLFARANRSTFLHETGHLFLEVFGDLVDRVRQLDPATLNPTQQKLLADYDALLQRLGVANRREIQREHHELFARMFETYLFEGRAPSIELRSVFARFSVWLKRIYRELRRLNAPLTDEVRGIFDRLLASDAAIAQAEAQGRLQPLFTTAEQGGMTAEQFAEYTAAAEGASQRGDAALTAQLLAEVAREEQADYKALRADVRAQVERAVHKQPVYQALAAMRRGTTPDGTPLEAGQEPVPLRLSRRLIEARYGTDRLRTLPPLISVKEDGLDPDAVAATFGFSSGDDLLTAVAIAPPMQAVIEQETDRRLQQQDPSMLVDGTLLEQAQAASANTERDSVLRAELRALLDLQRTQQAAQAARPTPAQAARSTAQQVARERAYERRWFEAEAKLRIAIAEGRKQAVIDRLEDEVDRLHALARGGPAAIRSQLPTRQQVQAFATQRIASTRVRDLRPSAFWATARRAAQQAIEAAARQDFAAAADAKRTELVNLALYREAMRAQADVDRRVRRARALGTPATRQRLGFAGQNYLDQVDGILDRYEFAAVPLAVLERRAAMADFIAGLQGEGLPVDLPAEVVNDARRINYKQVSVEELVGVTDGLEQILHLARLQTRLLREQQKRELDEVAQTLDASIRAHARGVRRPPARDRRATEERRRTIGDFFASHRKLASLLREMDGFEDGGAAWDAIMLPLNEAAAREAEMNADATRRFAEIIERAFPGRAKRTLYTRHLIPAVGKSLSRMERVMVALNWGNEGNRDRVRRAETWTDAQVQAILDTLTVEDLAFVQEVWDFIDSYWPAIEAKQRRVTGLPPTKVEAVGFTAAAGAVRGGYFPLKYDDRLSARAQAALDLEAANLAKHAAYVQATTRRGHTQERAARVELPVRLDFGVLFEHVAQVIHDLTHHEALIDVGRILGHRTVQTAIYETHGDLVYKQMRNAVRDVAFGAVPATNGFERALNHLRAGATIAGLGWNLTTALLQPTGLFNAAVRIGPRWMVQGLTRWLRNPTTMVETVHWINEQSVFMRARARTQQREINEIRNEVGIATGRLSGWVDAALSTTTFDTVTRQGIADSYFWFIQQAQRLVDVPTWLGAYEKAMAAGEPEERAVQLADQAVLDSQGGGQIKDLAQVQRGGPMLKLWTNFYSFFNVVYNQTVESTKRARFNAPGSIGRLAADYLMLFVMPVTVGYAVRAMMRPGEEDDDDALAWALAMETVAYLSGTLLGLREVSGTLQGYYGYDGPSGARAFSALANLGQQVQQGEADAAFWRALNETGGIIFHYPAGQAKRTLEGISALADGRTRNPVVVITGPPKEE